jgi:hypothetical protein
MVEENKTTEFHRAVMQNVTNTQCYNLGVTHKGYGWEPSPSKQWDAEQKRFYLSGYRMTEILHE